MVTIPIDAMDVSALKCTFITIIFKLFCTKAFLLICSTGSLALLGAEEESGWAPSAEE